MEDITLVLRDAKEIGINRDDLVMILVDPFITLGLPVCEEKPIVLKNNKDRLRMNNVAVLHRCETSYIGIKFPELCAFVEDSIHHYNIGSIEWCCVGQENIVKMLKKIKGYELHAEWIAKIQKPYPVIQE